MKTSVFIVIGKNKHIPSAYWSLMFIFRIMRFRFVWEFFVLSCQKINWELSSESLTFEVSIKSQLCIRNPYLFALLFISFCKSCVRKCSETYLMDIVCEIIFKLLSFCYFAILFGWKAKIVFEIKLILSYIQLMCFSLSL